MPWKNDQFVKAPRKKYRSVITVKLRNIWPKITKSQRLGWGYHKNNRHTGNSKNRF